MKLHFIFFLCLLLLTACGTEEVAPESELASLTEEKEYRLPDSQGPWNGAIYLAESEDGLSFSGKELVMENAGVPHLLNRANGDLVLTYQYFSPTTESEFDVIAYSVSEDQGETWSERALVRFENLPEPAALNLMPMDPALVETEGGSLRLYFTYHVEGNKNAALYSAVAADGKMTSVFEVAPEPALELDEMLLDPAVVFFEGVWHHYSWNGESDLNYHSTSRDGVSFTRAEDVVLPMDFLGQVVPAEQGLRFYGTSGKGGVISAYSSDGYTWEMEENILTQGADPAVAEIDDENFIMIYTSMNFNK